MAEVQGIPFRNSETCEGVAYVADGAPLDYSQIIVSGRYPETGWAMNEKSHEIVTLQRGVGRLVLAKAGPIELRSKPVHVPAGEWFAWEGDMTIGMACSPPFNKDQYKVIEINADDEILLRVHQVLDQYFPEDRLFVELDGMDENEILGFLKGQLILTDIDPDEVFRDFGITEEES